MKDNNYEFHVGDEVETVDGMVGKIVSICHCEKCAERGFFEPKWETADGKYSDYITVYDMNYGFPGYRRIGKYVWDRNTDEEKSAEHCKKENKEIKEIKLTIDGKEVQLTDEQLKVLRLEVRNNPFERVNRYRTYSYISAAGRVVNTSDDRIQADDNCYDVSNYFNDENFARQVALHQLLYRKLLKFAYEQGYEDVTEWNGGNPHWYISYATDIMDFVVGEDFVFKNNKVYFSSENSAERAIEEVVKPFVKDHPEFKW